MSINENVNRLEVSLKNIEYNLKQIQKYVGEDVEVMPVIKANAYGIGAIYLKDILERNNIKFVAVAVLNEAIDLRNAGIKTSIILLNEILECEIKEAIENKLTMAISSYELASKINEIAKKNKIIANIHIKIDTGMGRTGICIKEKNSIILAVDEIEKIKQLENINIEGIYTHLADAENDTEYTKNQINNFDNLVKELEKIGIQIRYKHILASSGIINYTHSKYNMVRPGIMLYGYPLCKNEKIDLKPTTSLKSKIAFIKTVEKDTSIGYGRTYITNCQTKIATIPMGYADGIRRELSNNGYVYINGVKVPIVGTVCMDDFMVDVSNIPNVKVGDDVVIWDNENIKIEEVAKRSNTITHDILCGISPRVERIYINE